MHGLHGQVTRLIQRAADEIILPRYRKLAVDEREEKTPGDFVTIADRESEEFLSAELLRLLPDARVMGEEAEATTPGHLSDPGCGAVWTVDPLDGTNNFAAGRAPFAVMVGLTVDGTSEAGWIFDPLTRRMCHAARGRGAFINEERMRSTGSGEDLPVAAISVIFLKPAERQWIAERTKDRMRLVPIPRCAGEQYPRIAIGQNDVASFKRTRPWDHVPGALFLEEAGGKVARFDGSPYRIDDAARSGLLAAATPKLWDLAAAILDQK